MPYTAAASEFDPSNIQELRDSKQELILKVQTMKKVGSGATVSQQPAWGAARQLAAETPRQPQAQPARHRHRALKPQQLGLRAS